QLDLVIADDLHLISGDAIQLGQVVLNLVINARDAMPAGGQVQVALSNTELDERMASAYPEAHPGAYVLVEVEDTGTGMPPELLDRIFDPFFTTKEQGKGTGLGLATVLGIVQRHGGFLDVESQVGRGTVFRIWLPAVQANTME